MVTFKQRSVWPWTSYNQRDLSAELELEILVHIFGRGIRI